MKIPFASALAHWRSPRIVVLDLRPLQCAYANKGIGRYTREIAQRLAAQCLADGLDQISNKKRARYQVFSLVVGGLPNPLPDIPVKILAPMWERMWIWDQVFLPFILAKNHVRIFHNFVAVGPLDRISFPVLYGFRTIATVHDWHMFSEDASAVEKFYRGTRRIKIQLNGLKKVWRLIVDSEQVKVDTILQAGGNPTRISVVTPGGDHLDAAPASPWPMENFVLSIGDTPNKNLSFTQDVLALLRSRFIHLNWVIVGNRAVVLKQLGLEEWTVPPWMTVLENPSDAQLKACYLKALCLLFPSTREGFGIPVLEAMRLGCPVLAPNIEPMKSLLAYAPGLLRPDSREDWSSAVSKLLYDHKERRSASDFGTQRAEELTWDAATKNLLAVYDS